MKDRERFLEDAEVETGDGNRRGGLRGGKGGLSTLLEVPHYPPVLVAGLLFDFARIGMAFLGPYYMNEATHSPRLVQLTGSASWAFLIAGPFFGVISDRFDRRRTVLIVAASMATMTAIVGVLVINGMMRPWIMFVYMVLSSICTVLDTTNRPALVYDVLHVSRAEIFVGTAMALRSIGSNAGKIFGNQAIGHVVEATGVGHAFLVVAAMLAGVGLLVGSIPSPPKATDRKKAAKGASIDSAADTPDEPSSRPPADAGVLGEIWAGVNLAKNNVAFLSFLGATFLANFFYWSHMPLLQVLASRLDATPSETGLLLSGSGWGGLAASLIVTATNPTSTGLLYCVGIAFADAVLPLATVPDFHVAFGALVGSGFLAGLFGAVQSAMVMNMVPDELRGRALGMLTMAIGAGPFGMAVLGELAELFGAAVALWYFALAGFALQGAWLMYRPEALWIRRGAIG